MNILALAVVVAAAVLPASVRGGDGEDNHRSLAFTLERTSHEGLEISQLKEVDQIRHRRFLQQQPIGVVDFPVGGTYDPYLVGLYYTKVKLGNPPKEFYVQIDSGSDVLWVSCNPCSGCPRSSGLQIPLQFFDPPSSTTAQPIKCSDQLCSAGEQSSDAVCSSGQCGYTFQYGDGSGTTGYYVSDAIYLDTVAGNSYGANTTARIAFGCSTSQTGDLRKPDRAVDGIFGFGQQSLSVISQLSSQGLVPKAFSHCLIGGANGGGILVLGRIVEPNIVYTALVPSQPHYNVNLQSIAVNGQALPISSSVFATGDNQGTIIDSGTTLAYLAEGAYDTFINAITTIASQNSRPIVAKGSQCFLTTSSISVVFPVVTLNFAGGASMNLNPQDYLLQQNPIGGASVWCIGFQKIQGQQVTILGDLVLKDKIVVYDLGNQRIGWVSYDCSSSVNVSISNTGPTQFVNANTLRDNSAADRMAAIPSFIAAGASFLYIGLLQKFFL